ncbi:MAG: GNAT family N-acetyltransferase [Gaiellales bacterium]
MSDDEVRLLEGVEAEAFAGFFPDDSFAVGGAVAVASPAAPMLMMNRVIGLGVHEPASDDELDEIGERFADRRHMIGLAPGAEPADLADRLRARGYLPGNAWVKFRRSAISPAPVATDLRVERVEVDQADEFARVVAEGYGMGPSAGEPLRQVVGRPGWACYVAYAGDEPAAAGMVFVGAGAAWLGGAATIPRFRRRGGQSAIMAERIRHAASCGCRRIVTETGELAPGQPDVSHRNILRFGFEAAYVRPNFVSPEPSTAA